MFLNIDATKDVLLISGLNDIPLNDLYHFGGRYSNHVKGGNDLEILLSFIFLVLIIHYVMNNITKDIGNTFSNKVTNSSMKFNNVLNGNSL